MRVPARVRAVQHDLRARRDEQVGRERDGRPGGGVGPARGHVDREGAVADGGEEGQAARGGGAVAVEGERGGEGGEGEDGGGAVSVSVGLEVFFWFFLKKRER